MNENGEMFADFCAEHSLVIGGCLFPHKTIHKVTWVSPNHVTENQIEHICIGRRFRKSLQDTRVKRGADAASDHHLVTAKQQLELKKCTTRCSKIKYDVEFLNDKRTTKQCKLTEEEDSCTLDSRWQHVKKVWTKTCEETPGHKKIQHKWWRSAYTLQKVDERKRKEILNNSRSRT